MVSTNKTNTRNTDYYGGNDDAITMVVMMMQLANLHNQYIKSVLHHHTIDNVRGV